MNYKRLFIPNSYIFITICTYKRQNILIDNIEYLRKSFKYALSVFNFEIIAIVVNPDHLHMIIKTENINNYPKIIGIIKKHFTQISNIKYSINENRESNIWQVCPPYLCSQDNLKIGYKNKREKGLFQRRFYEHTIRDENDLYKHIDYIHYNPVKHGLSTSPKNWTFSSFNKFVKEGLYDEN